MIGEMRRVGDDGFAQLAEIVIRQRLPSTSDSARRIAQSSFASPGGNAARVRALHPALEIDVEAFLLRIGGARQDDIGIVRAGVAMAALIDDEGAAEMGDIELVGAEQIDEVDLALLRAVDDAGDVAAASPGTKPRSSAPRATPRCAGR